MSTVVRPRSAAFERFAGGASIAVGIGGLLYGILFVAIVYAGRAWMFKAWYALLLLGGFLSTAVAVALYERLRHVDAAFALWALTLGLFGALGGIVHGAYHLSQVLNAGHVGPGLEEVTRGVLRYGVAGLALLVVALLIWRSGTFPRGLAYLAYAAGAVLVFIYLGRLTEFITPAHKITLVPPFLYGLVVHPALYVWLGLELRRGAPAAEVVA